MPEDFTPGDVIARTFQNGSVHRWYVLDPVRTGAGKLRVVSLNSGAIKTTWWRPDALPQGYRKEIR